MISHRAQMLTVLAIYLLVLAAISLAGVTGGVGGAAAVVVIVAGTCVGVGLWAERRASRQTGQRRVGP